MYASTKERCQINRKRRTRITNAELFVAEGNKANICHRTKQVLLNL